MYAISSEEEVVLLLELILYILLDAVKFNHSQDFWNKTILLIFSKSEKQ